jgi:hypothetical protein
MSKNKNLPATKQKQDVVIHQDQTPAAFMQMALNKNLDLERIEKLIEFQERAEKREAEKAYHDAMANFKLNPPKIYKNKHVHFETSKGSKDYDHATIGNVVEKIITGLSECGLSHSWKPEQLDNGNIKVTCTITHRLGHSESVDMFAPADPSGGKNPVQAISSTVSYLERYTLLAITGLATHDQDNDGVAPVEIEYIDEKQKSTILDMVTATNTTEEEFLNYLKVDSIDNIPASIYNAAIAALNTKAEVIRKESNNDNN